MQLIRFDGDCGIFLMCTRSTRRAGWSPLVNIHHDSPWTMDNDEDARMSDGDGIPVLKNKGKAKAAYSALEDDNLPWYVTSMQEGLSA